MPKIFISYRREDSTYLSGIIASRLASAFGKRSIVLDVDNIPPGQDFRDYIKRELEACDLLVAVIGKNWFTVRDETGQSRLENPNDWVRLELEAALGRESKIPVIPVLLDNVPPPKAEQLPASLRELAYRQAFSVRPPSDFDQDVDKLIQKIKVQEKVRKTTPIRAPKAIGPNGAARFRRPLVLGSVAIIAAVAVLLAIILVQRPNGARIDDPSRIAKRPTESSGSSEKSLATVSKTSQPKPNKGGEPSVPPEARAEAPFKVVSPPPSDARAVGQFGGSRAGQTRDVNGLRLIWIPPGDFTMGSPKDEKDRMDNEDQVQVTLTKGLWLGQHEVTQAEWRRVMQTAPWSGKDFVQEGDDYPATYVSWDDAMKFCENFTEQERSANRLPSGWQYTLPTEAQWEYACRGGTKSRFYFGDDESGLGEYAWFDKNAWDVGKKYAHTVGQKKANPWALNDMHGNVWEWCRDWYAKQLTGGTDPPGPSEGSLRVFRGGCWRFPAGDCRSAIRIGGAPWNGDHLVGFRVAAVPSGK